MDSIRGNATKAEEILVDNSTPTTASVTKVGVNAVKVVEGLEDSMRVVVMKAANAARAVEGLEDSTRVVIVKEASIVRVEGALVDSIKAVVVTKVESIVRVGDDIKVLRMMI